MSVAVNPPGGPNTRPTSLIFSLYGDLVHGSAAEADPMLWLGTLVELMAAFGVSEAAVRQAVSRMARQGWLRAERVGKRAYYTVTDRGRRRIEELSPRIYGPVIEWDGKWRVLAATIDERGTRTRLRQELRVLGWAPLSPAVWISPADALGSAVEAAERYGASGESHLFVGTYEGAAERSRIGRTLLGPAVDRRSVRTVYRHLPAASGVGIASRRTWRACGLRRTTVARHRVSEVRISRSRIAQRIGPGALARDDCGRNISRILCRAGTESAAIPQLGY